MKKLLMKIDIPLFLMMVFYSILGLVMILSASSVSAVLRYKVSSYHFFIRQIVFVFCSFFFGIYIVLNIKTSKYKLFVPLFLIGILIALIGLFFHGMITNHAQSWYDLGFFKFLPWKHENIEIFYIASVVI